MSQSSVTSPTLGFFLRLTKFAGQNKVPVLEWVLAWTTVVVFGLRYVIDYARLRWKLYNLAKNVVKSAVPVSPKLTTRSGLLLQQVEESFHNEDDTSISLSLLCDCVSLCPLTHTRKELSVGIEERWERLRCVLFLASSSILGHGHNDGRETKDVDNTNRGDGSGEAVSDSSSRIATMAKDWTDEDWVRVFRSNLDVRREASQLMFALSGVQQHTLGRQQHQPSSSQRKASIVLWKLRSLWPKFLELPQAVVSSIGDGAISSNDDSHSDYTNSSFDISLIVPMYRERITDIGYTLNHAFDNCVGDPKKIQVVVVHAQSSPNDSADPGNNDIMSGANSLLRQQILLQQQQNRQEEVSDQEPNKTNELSVWGELKIVTIPFGEGGGRGKTLNVGAGQATAPILTFLHADTMLPLGWDGKIKEALLLSLPSGKSKDKKNNHQKTEAVDAVYFPHACAFTMAIDDDKESSNHTIKSASSKFSTASPLSSKSKIPGLIGAEWLGVLRCYCGLPYGDSVLSFSRSMFDYMGGYPDQPLMEDYEVMDWLRLRSVLLSTIYRMSTKGNIDSSSVKNNRNNKNAMNDSNSLVGVTRGEGLVLLKDRAKCSPRRWKKYGVAYTSLVNAICIFRYRSKATTEELFDFYYHCTSSTSKPN